MTALKNSLKLGFATRAIHEGYDPRSSGGSLVPPVHMTSTYVFENVAEGAALFAGEKPGHFYSRISNPTVELLEKRLATLESAEAAVAFASGMGAITSVLWTLLESGDEIIVDETLYGCTFTYMQEGLSKFGVKVRFVNMRDLDLLEASITSATKLFFYESPANPNMRLVDIKALSKIARTHGILSVVDNTYCTPYLSRPIEMGADLVVHSATKYLGGHGDLIAGLAAGSQEIMTRVRLEGLKDMTGSVMSPLVAHQVMRGLKTLEIRMERHSQSAQAIAEFLAENRAVAQVYFPGLPTFSQFSLAQKQMKLPGGMIAFELRGGLEAGIQMMDSLQLIQRAVSLGDADSLIQHPASMTHSVYSPEERKRHHISDGLVRLSVGLETVEDLISDLQQALAPLMSEARNSHLPSCS